MSMSLSCPHGSNVFDCLNCELDGRRAEALKTEQEGPVLGTCQGCGMYGPVGDVHVRAVHQPEENVSMPEECGEYL